MTEAKESISGLSENEAKEFHGVFMTSFLGFTAIAVLAHILVWMWRPWIPGDDGYAAVNSVNETATAFLTMIA